MIGISAVIRAVPGVTEAQLRRWLAADFLRPEGEGDAVVFSEADIARLHLLRDLHMTLDVEERTIPLVLALIDQLYATRWELRRLAMRSDIP